MSRANPTKAMAALIPAPIKCGCGISVKPMTLGMYAVLERIKSPIVTGQEPADCLEMIPSLYLLTHDPREVFDQDLVDRAITWADTLPVTAIEEIKSAAYRQLGVMFDVVPEDNSDPLKKKRPTGGLRRSSTGLAANSGGRSSKSSGKRRCRQSTC